MQRRISQQLLYVSWLVRLDTHPAREILGRLALT
jgi:hypothetical protein